MCIDVPQQRIVCGMFGTVLARFVLPYMGFVNFKFENSRQVWCITCLQTFQLVAGSLYFNINSKSLSGIDPSVSLLN